MIGLEKDYNTIADSLNSFSDCGYLYSVFCLHLESYGVRYTFQEIYLQKTSNKVSSMILRYNSNVYVLCSDDTDSSELFSFLNSFTNCEIIINLEIKKLLSAGFNSETLYEMRRTRICDSPESEKYVKINSDVTKSLSAVREYFSDNLFEDFLLNASYQQRHELLDVYSYCIGDEAVCVLGITRFTENIDAIIFLYTKENFRGNNFAATLLNCACKSDVSLICEEHNLNFYTNNYFIQVRKLSIIRV